MAHRMEILGAGLALALLASPANAAIYTAQLDVISKSTIGPQGVSQGNVRIEDVGTDVNVSVTLVSRVEFVNTGGRTHHLYITSI